MPIRDKFPKGYFEGNPFDGDSPERLYEKIQWGNRPNDSRAFRAPESMAAIGRLAKLFLIDGRQQEFRDMDYFVAVGGKSNWVYFVPIDEKGRALDFPKKFWEKCEGIGRVIRTDYYSEKGGDKGYYFHDHEKPFPMLCGHGEHYALRPAKVGGGRSYAVGPEGIIG